MQLIDKIQVKNKEKKEAIGELKMVIETDKMKKKQKMMKAKLEQKR